MPEIPSIRDKILADTRLHLPSRLAWSMTDVSSVSGDVFMSLRTMNQNLGASQTEIESAVRTVARQWKLFRWDRTSRSYRRALQDHETSPEFKNRVQRTIHLTVGISWVLRDLLEEFDDRGRVVLRGPAPHTNEQFADQLGSNVRSIRLTMDEVLRLGYFFRYNRRRKPLYTHPSDLDNEFYDQKYTPDGRCYDDRVIVPIRSKWPNKQSKKAAPDE